MKLKMIITTVCLTLSCQVIYAVDADEEIKYRQNVMKSVGGHTTALVSILKGKVAHKDAILVHATGLANASTASVVAAAFKENTHGKGSEKTTTTAKVWEEWDKYTEAIARLEKATAEIKVLAEEGKLTDFDQLKPALKECGECHRDSGFREKKK